MTWEEVCAHPALQELPFRIETNRWGQIVMSPPHNDHGDAQESIYDLLKKKMRAGKAKHETAIDTEDGQKVAGAAWMSAAFYKAHKGQASYRHAPEICVEVKSPGNTLGELLEKKDLYFEAGAQEVWIREQSGAMRFFNAEGPLERSTLCPTFPLTVEI